MVRRMSQERVGGHSCSLLGDEGGKDTSAYLEVEKLGDRSRRDGGVDQLGEPRRCREDSATDRPHGYDSTTPSHTQGVPARGGRRAFDSAPPSGSARQVHPRSYWRAAACEIRRPPKYTTPARELPLEKLLLRRYDSKMASLDAVVPLH